MLVSFDIDGTLCDQTNRLYLIRDHNDFDAFYKASVNDTPIRSVAELFQVFRDNPVHNVVFVTGRPYDYQQITESWLEYYLDIEMNFFPIYMREPGDYRPSYAVKQEHLEWVYDDFGQFPDLAFDDRDQDVQMFRSYDIRTLQVADGNL